MSRKQDIANMRKDNFEYFEKIETSLAAKLNLTDLSSGLQVIRDEHGWRQNEKRIEYIWIVTIARSFIGSGGLFAIQFEENNFREYFNPGELIQGLFSFGRDGVDEVYIDKLPRGGLDSFKEMFNVDLFEANKGIALDGVEYNIRIMANYIDTYVYVSNPNTERWKKWEAKIWAMGKRIAKDANDEEIIRLFE